MKVKLSATQAHFYDVLRLNPGCFVKDAWGCEPEIYCGDDVHLGYVKRNTFASMEFLLKKRKRPLWYTGSKITRFFELKKRYA